MLACKVLVGPIATDRPYNAGETIVLDEKDANQLASYGLLEIVGEVAPKFLPQIPVEVAPEVAVAESVVETPVEVAPEVVVTEPVVETEAVPEDILSFPVVETVPVEVAPEAVIDEPVVETPVEVAPEVVATEPVVETPVDESVAIDGEEALSLEEVPVTGAKRKK
jgi:hypothetical protein